MSVSVKGDSVTLLVDCQTVQSKQLLRPSPSHISQGGIGLLGKQLLEEDFFEVRFKPLRPGLFLQSRRNIFFADGLHLIVQELFILIYIGK